MTDFTTTLFVDDSDEGQPRYWIYSEKRDTWACFYLGETGELDFPGLEEVDRMAKGGCFEGFDEGVALLIERFGIAEPKPSKRQRPTVAQVKALEEEVEKFRLAAAAEKAGRQQAWERVDELSDALASASPRISRLTVQTESDDTEKAVLMDERDDARQDTNAIGLLTGYIAQEFPEASPRIEAFLTGVYSALQNAEA